MARSSRRSKPKLRVVKIVTNRTVAHAESIEMLEQALEEARSGEIVALGLAVVRPGGQINCGFSSSRPAGLLLGAIALLNQHAINRLEEV